MKVVKMSDFKAFLRTHGRGEMLVRNFEFLTVHEGRVRWAKTSTEDWLLELRGGGYVMKAGPTVGTVYAFSSKVEAQLAWDSLPKQEVAQYPGPFFKRAEGSTEVCLPNEEAEIQRIWRENAREEKRRREEEKKEAERKQAAYEAVLPKIEAHMKKWAKSGPGKMVPCECGSMSCMHPDYLSKPLLDLHSNEGLAERRRITKELLGTAG